MKKNLWCTVVLTYFVAVLYWALPVAIPFQGEVRHLVDAPFRYLGLWQWWDMFSPNPISQDIYVTATLRFQDGSEKHHNVSHMSAMGFYERYAKERWRKWASDNLRLDSSRDLWEPAARFLVAQHSADPANPVVSVSLARHWKSVFGGGQQEYQNHVFYELDLSPVQVASQ